MTRPPCKIPYNPRWTVILGSGLFFAVCGVVIAVQAATNDRGLILEGIFRFSPHGATLFYWVLAGISALFVLVAVFLALVRISTDRSLEIEADAVILPHGFLLRKLSRVPYSSIASVSEMVVKGQKSLRLHTSSRKYAISASLLPSQEVYAQLKQLIVERVGTEPSGAANRSQPIRSETNPTSEAAGSRR